MSDIESHFQEIDNNSYACYCLYSDKDKLIYNKIEDMRFDSCHYPENIHLNKKNTFLVIKNDVYALGDLKENELTNRIVMEPEIMRELRSIGISNISEVQDISKYELNTFLEQEKKDIKFSDHFFLANIPFDRRTDSVCMSALKKHDLNINDIPGYMFTAQRIERILDTDYTLARDMPKELLNEKICINAIKKDSLIFSHIPEELKTEKVCKEAFNQAKIETDDPAYLGSIVEKIPHANASMNLLEQYVGTHEFYTILLSIPDKVFNQEIAGFAVKLDPNSILDIPDRLISEKMVESALKTDIHLLKAVPDRYKTVEMCQEILSIAPSDDEQRHLLFKDIPYSDLVIEALHFENFKDCPATLLADNIPNEVMNKEIAMELVKRDAGCLQFIPFHLKDENICLEAINGAKTIDPLYAIPRDSMTDKVSISLVNRFPQAIRDILPIDMRSAEVCYIAVKQNESLDRFIPKTIKNSCDMNIYRFGRLVDEKIEEKLTHNQVMDLYKGKTLTIKNTITPNPDKNKEMVNVKYNHVNKSLEYSYYTPNKIAQSTLSSKNQQLAPKNKL